MKNKLFIISFSILILSLLLASCSVEKKKTIEIKSGFVGMIGYGTLMSVKSLEQTLKHKYNDSLYQVHLINYIRGWTYFVPINDPPKKSTEDSRYYGFILQGNDSIAFDGMVNLNIEPKEKSKINCILYIISEEDLLKFDKREFGYQKVDVTNQIEEYNFIGGKVYVYEHFPETKEISKIDTNKYILVKNYVDFITNACDSIGKIFRNEFDESTNPPTTQIVPYDKIVWKKGR